MNYSVSSSSPTDELLTVGQILSEVGDYASTILDREHLSLSRKCTTRLNKVVSELISRQCIVSADNLCDIPQSEIIGNDLSAMTIAELHSLYRRWPMRHKEREAEDREPFTFYFEGRIVLELKKRKASDRAEQLKIDYCVATYHNELYNLSAVFSRPVRIDTEKITPYYEHNYTSEDLKRLIILYRNYRDIAEREILVEYVDRALDLLEQDENATSTLGLLTEIAEIGRKKIIRIPAWINKKLEDTVKLALASKTGNEAELPLAMLTLQMLSGDSSWERRAKRIINRCYKSAFNESLELSKRIENLHTAVTCCDYVTRFSVRKAATLWHELTTQALSSSQKLSPKQTSQLLDIANECAPYAPISDYSRNKLQQLLVSMLQLDFPKATAFSKLAKIKI